MSRQVGLSFHTRGLYAASKLPSWTSIRFIVYLGAFPDNLRIVSHHIDFCDGLTTHSEVHVRLLHLLNQVRMVKMTRSDGSHLISHFIVDLAVVIHNTTLICQRGNGHILYPAAMSGI